MKGDFNPKDYEASNIRSSHQDIICGLGHRVRADSLKSYLQQLEAFYTRHTYADTLSNKTGIGAARRWAFSKFKEISLENENRLIPSYLQFDYPNGSCGPGYGWKNVLAVLPGSDVTNHQIVLIEAHMDSRCEVPCDVNCFAPGVEDNGSGTALVIELARALSTFTFKHTIVFMLTIGEEEGLYGAEAMAKYCIDEGIAIKGVLNNDIVGAIECGETASPPGCPGEGDLDSTHVRLFTNGSILTQNRGFARSIKLYNDEMLKGLLEVPMDVEIMNQEDRTGRGGDHIPFRIQGFTNVRFTSANEHGDAHPDAEYTDRQHTSKDVLGSDIDSNGIIEEYFVNFEYLKRNAIINGTALTMLALGPKTPEFEVFDEPAGLRVEIKRESIFKEYRIGVRKAGLSQAFTAMYRTTETNLIVPGMEMGKPYWISVAGIDENNITSIFSNEIVKTNDATTDVANVDDLPYSLNCSVLGNQRPHNANIKESIKLFPNPTNGTIRIEIPNGIDDFEFIRFSDLQGKFAQEIALNGEEMNIKLGLRPGIYFYEIHGKRHVISTGKLIMLPN